VVAFSFGESFSTFSARFSDALFEEVIIQSSTQTTYFFSTAFQERQVFKIYRKIYEKPEIDKLKTSSTSLKNE